MKTYQSPTIYESLSHTIKKLNKKFSNPISFLRATWPDIAPEWALEAWPSSIKNQTVFFKVKKNPLIMQFREKELLKVVQLLIGDSVSKVKIFAN